MSLKLDTDRERESYQLHYLIQDKPNRHGQESERSKDAHVTFLVGAPSQDTCVRIKCRICPSSMPASPPLT